MITNLQKSGGLKGPHPPRLRRGLLKLRVGFSNVLTEIFNQNSLEEQFGNIRKVKKRNDNSSYQLGYSENVARIKRSITQVTGNTKEKQAIKEEFHGKRLTMFLLKNGKKKITNILCHSQRCCLKLLYSLFILYILFHSVCR